MQAARTFRLVVAQILHSLQDLPQRRRIIDADTALRSRALQSIHSLAAGSRASVTIQRLCAWTPSLSARSREQSEQMPQHCGGVDQLQQLHQCGWAHGHD